MNQVPVLEDSVEIEAPAGRVWEVVSDVRRMAEWSPQVESTRLAEGIVEIELGARFTNLNRQGELIWKTHGTVVRFDVDREFAFRIEENWTVWSFQLEETDHATVVLTQRREAPEGVSDLSQEWIETFMGGHTAFTETMRAGMTETLAGIRAAVLAEATS